MEGQPPLSELILNAAMEHFSEEVLLRTPEQSYELILEAERQLEQPSQQQHHHHYQQQPSQPGGQSEQRRSEAVQEWQNDRKIQQEEGGPSVYEQTLNTGV
eukprot:CAMPEP_0202454986 /NCGR_PEP_ID=MMETSP1360-20130828/12619_1 /ASSEMBLY_ACC=CAM_ASM_000848 /TAXON_ID=515479 /ORGANISM="Licmophora paradoxa, Strain CCMP2313" /LENGTH=100 /DNA_ID=CAMNT_0049074455 /DNA_START=71 /DNA_END=373 /DNA_ORIENTATION=+